MNTIPRIIAVATLLALPIAKAATLEINAPELAYHLGCYTWVSQFQLKGDDLQVEICSLKNGEISKPILFIPAFATDRDFTRIAIIVGPTEAKTRLSLQIDASPKTRATIPSPDIQTIIPLPAILQKGDYFLGGVCDENHLKSVRDSRDLKLSDCKTGLVLRVK